MPNHKKASQSNNKQRTWIDISPRCTNIYCIYCHGRQLGKCESKPCNSTLHPLKWEWVIKRDNTCWRDCGEAGRLMLEIVCLLWKTIIFLWNIKYQVSLWLQIPFLVVHPIPNIKEMYIHSKMGVWMSTRHIIQKVEAYQITEELLQINKSKHWSITRQW